VDAEPLKAVSDPEEHRMRLERQAQEAAYPQQRVGARIRWVAAVLAGLVVVGSGVLLVTMSGTSQPRSAALSSVPLPPATAPPPTSSVSRPPTQSVVPVPPLTGSVTATRSSVAQPPPPTVPVGRCSGATTSTFNDDAAGITFSGSWKASRDRGFGDFGDDVHFTTSNGSFASLSFSGTGISLFGETNLDQGRMDVVLDGKLQRTVDTTSATRRAQQVLFTACGLQPGFHNIRAVKRSGSYMVIDRFDVTS
jgi:hypothetical protein